MRRYFLPYVFQIFAPSDSISQGCFYWVESLAATSFVVNLNYEDNYTEDAIVFTAMEQSNSGFYDKKLEYFGDEGVIHL